MFIKVIIVIGTECVSVPYCYAYRKCLGKVMDMYLNELHSYSVYIISIDILILIHTN